LYYDCFVDFVESEKFYVFSGISIAWDAGCVLQMCQADEKVALDSNRRSSCPTGKHGERMGKKRFKFTKVAMDSADCSTSTGCLQRLMIKMGRHMRVLRVCLMLYLNLFLSVRSLKLTLGCCRLPSLCWNLAKVLFMYC
jgi:hypothetical protein